MSFIEYIGGYGSLTIIILYLIFLGYAIMQMLKFEKGIYAFLWILLAVAFPIIGPGVYLVKRMLLE